MTSRAECYCCHLDCGEPGSAVWELGVPVTAPMDSRDHIRQLMDYTHACDKHKDEMMEPGYKAYLLPESVPVYLRAVWE